MGQEEKFDYEAIHEAFLDAFRTYDLLKRMVKFKLNTHLSQIAPSTKPLPEVVFDLIDYFEAQGKLLELIKQAHKYIPGNPKLKKIYKNCFSFESLEKLILSQDRIDELIQILQDINNLDLLRNICCQTISKLTDARGEIASCNDVISLLEILLESYPKQTEDAPPAIFEFAQRLYDCNKEDIIDRLKYQIKEWLIKATEKTKFSFPIKYKQLPKQHRRFSQYIAIIVHDIEPDEQFQLSLTRFDINNIEDTSNVYFSDSYFYKKTNIAKEITYLIDRAFNLVDNLDDKTVIELFLSYEQIINNDCIDLEKIKEDFGDLVPIGYQYCFVIRCLDRYLSTNPLNSFNGRNITNFKNKLLERWKLVIDLVSMNHDKNIIVNKSDYLDGINSCNWRELLLEWEEKEKISVNITCCLEKDENSKKFFQYLLRGGIPLCLWNRSTNFTSDEVEQEFKQIVTLNSNSILNDIYKTVHSIRKHAHVKGNKAEKYIGYHLGFLLDHPDRIPSCINEMY